MYQIYLAAVVTETDAVTLESKLRVHAHRYRAQVPPPPSIGTLMPVGGDSADPKLFSFSPHQGLRFRPAADCREWRHIRLPARSYTGSSTTIRDGHQIRFDFSISAAIRRIQNDDNPLTPADAGRNRQ